MVRTAWAGSAPFSPLCPGSLALPTESGWTQGPDSEAASSNSVFTLPETPDWDISRDLGEAAAASGGETRLARVRQTLGNPSSKESQTSFVVI